MLEFPGSKGLSTFNTFLVNCCLKDLNSMAGLSYFLPTPGINIWPQFLLHMDFQYWVEDLDPSSSPNYKL